jgi:hypothetical protein
LLAVQTCFIYACFVFSTAHLPGFPTSAAKVSYCSILFSNEKTMRCF